MTKLHKYYNHLREKSEYIPFSFKIKPFFKILDETNA